MHRYFCMFLQDYLTHHHTSLQAKILRTRMLFWLFFFLVDLFALRLSLYATYDDGVAAATINSF